MSVSVIGKKEMSIKDIEKLANFYCKNCFDDCLECYVKHFVNSLDDMIDFYNEGFYNELGENQNDF